MTAPDPGASPREHGTREQDVATIPDAAWPNLVMMMHLLQTSLERQAQRDGDVSHGQFMLLVLLSGAKDQTRGLTDLADTLRYSPSRVSHALTVLERRGLVTRRRTAGGRRAWEATLTREGRLLTGRVLRGQRRDIRDPLLAELGDADAATLAEVSARVITVLDEARSG
jgi:DNA-binding MarR family transcriptional regulator